MTRRGALAVEARFAHTSQASQRTVRTGNQFARAIPAFVAPTLPVAGRQYAIPGTSRLLRWAATRHTPADGRTRRACPSCDRPPRHNNIGRIACPTRTEDYHHEVVSWSSHLSNGGRDIPVVAALDRVFGYGVGLDLTVATFRPHSRSRENPGRWASAQTSPPWSRRSLRWRHADIRGYGSVRPRERQDRAAGVTSRDASLDNAAHHRRAIHLVSNSCLATSSSPGTPEGVGPLQGAITRSPVSGLARLELELV